MNSDPAPIIRPLNAETPTGVVKQLEELLKADESAFALESEHVESIDERMADAEGSDRRILLWAELGAQPAGAIDVVLHSPEAGTMTIAMVVVSKAMRHRGVGRALVRDAVRRAMERAFFDVIAAGIHRDNATAQSFFGAIGLEAALGDDPNDPIVEVAGEPMRVA